MKSPAYLAGLIDGDGSIIVSRRDKGLTKHDRKRKMSFELVVKVGGETHHMLALRREWGNIGSVYVRKRPGQRHLAEWLIAARQSRIVLRQIARYLKLKKRQAQNGLSFPMCRSRWDATPGFRREQLRRWRLMKYLNSRVGRGTVTYHGRRS